MNLCLTGCELFRTLEGVVLDHFDCGEFPLQVFEAFKRSRSRKQFPKASHNLKYETLVYLSTPIQFEQCMMHCQLFTYTTLTCMFGVGCWV